MWLITPFLYTLYREYALRRTKDAFRENKTLTDEVEIKAFIQKAEKNLEIMKRQVS